MIFEFIEDQRAKGYLLGAMTVSEINSPLIKRFIVWRLNTGVSRGTVESDLAALRSCVNWARQKGYLESVPVIMKAQKERGRETPAVSYTLPELGRFFNAASENLATYHVIRTSVIVLFTLARVEAVLAAHTNQRQGNFFDFCLPGDSQTAKLRRLAYLGDTVRPWLDMPSGKLIQYDEFGFQRPPRPNGVHPRAATNRIGKPFDRILVQAGILRPDAEPRPHTRGSPNIRFGNGSPNALRHTIMTYLSMIGVPEEQVKFAAGHSTRLADNPKVMIRPDRFNELRDGFEQLSTDLAQYTDVHKHAYRFRPIQDYF